MLGAESEKRSERFRHSRGFAHISANKRFDFTYRNWYDFFFCSYSGRRTYRESGFGIERSTTRTGGLRPRIIFEPTTENTDIASGEKRKKKVLPQRLRGREAGFPHLGIPRDLEMSFRRRPSARSFNSSNPKKSSQIRNSFPIHETDRHQTSFCPA